MKKQYVVTIRVDRGPRDIVWEVALGVAIKALADAIDPAVYPDLTIDIRDAKKPHRWRAVEGRKLSGGTFLS